MANRTISDFVRTMSNFFRFGTVRLKDASGTVEMRNGGDSAYAPIGSASLRLKGATSGETVLQAAPEATATYILPAADGSSGQALITDAAGNLSWGTIAVASGEVKSHTEPIVFGTGASNIAIVTPPANAFILKVVVDVDEAFDASPAASLSVGVVGTVSRYMGATDIDLTTVGVYEVEPLYQEDGTPEEIVAVWSPGTGGTTGSLNVTVMYANPIDD